MSVRSSQTKVGRLTPTKTTGIYFRLKKNGSKTFYARRPDGNRNFEACESFDAAKTRRAEFTGKIAKGQVIGDPTRTLAQVIVEWEQTRTHVKPRTREMENTLVCLYIRPALGRTRVRDITRGTIVKFLAGLTRKDGQDAPLSGGTKTLILSTLS